MHGSFTDHAGDPDCYLVHKWKRFLDQVITRVNFKKTLAHGTLIDKYWSMRWRREQQHDSLVPGEDWQVFCDDRRIATDLTEEESRALLEEYGTENSDQGMERTRRLQRR